MLNGEIRKNNNIIPLNKVDNIHFAQDNHLHTPTHVIETSCLLK